ncbi:PilZ domain-containing protein [Caulobacter henricii]
MVAGTTKKARLHGRLTAPCVYGSMSKYASGGEGDRRGAPRLATQRAGKLLSGTFAWDCVIRDVSESGIRVQMLAGVAPPAQVQLVDLAAGLAHDVQLAWQREREVGFKILKSHDLRGLTHASARTAKNLWMASQARLSVS